MLFEKVTKQHILDGIEDYNAKGLPIEYGPSSMYYLVYKGGKYFTGFIVTYFLI